MFYFGHGRDTPPAILAGPQALEAGGTLDQAREATTRAFQVLAGRWFSSGNHTEAVTGTLMELNSDSVAISGDGSRTLRRRRWPRRRR